MIDDTDLERLRALDEAGIPYFVGGLLAAALRGMNVTPRTIDLYVAQHTDIQGPRIRIHRYTHPDRFKQQYAQTRELDLRGLRVRVQSYEGIRDDIDYFCGPRDARDFFAAIAASPPPPPTVDSVPETNLGMFIGDRLWRALDCLHAAGYTQASTGRPGTYTLYYDNDVDPRTGISSSGISVYEDPARPVIHTIRSR